MESGAADCAPKIQLLPTVAKSARPVPPAVEEANQETNSLHLLLGSQE